MIDIIKFIVKNWPAIILTTTLMFLILVLYRIFNSSNIPILTGDPTDNPEKVNKPGGFFFGADKWNTGLSPNAVNQVQVDGFSNYKEYDTTAHNPKVMKSKGRTYLSSDKGCSSLPDEVCKWHPEYRDVCVWAIEKVSKKGKCVPASMSGAPLNTNGIDYWCGKTGKVHYKGSHPNNKDEKYKNIKTCQGHSMIM